MHDYQVLQSIEKYDSLADTWHKMYFKLPKPMAKLGTCLQDDHTILIAGGMSKDFEPTAEVWTLALSTLEWTQRASMFAPRLTSSGLIFSEAHSKSYIYAIGGNKTRHCERYDCGHQCWEVIPSFTTKVGDDVGASGYENCLFTYGMCASLRFD